MLYKEGNLAIKKDFIYIYIRAYSSFYTNTPNKFLKKKKFSEYKNKKENNVIYITNLYINNII